MPLKITDALAILACDTLVDQIDIGTNPGKLVIYDGTAPTDLATSITTQKTLVTLTLQKPAFGNAATSPSGATASANAVTSVKASADGTASFFRIFNGNNVAVMQGDISLPGAGGQLEVSSTAVISGIDVVVVSLTATMPKA